MPFFSHKNANISYLVSRFNLALQKNNSYMCRMPIFLRSAQVTKCYKHNDQLPLGLLAQLVERCTGIAEVMVSNPYGP